ncbi:MAG TPA: hypothetical protein VIX20_11835, partial [Ktedonobacteraceae bacterium]
MNNKLIIFQLLPNIYENLHILIVAIALIIVGYQLNWTGFKGKTLWDWLNLLGVLAIPIMVAVGAFWLNQLQKERDERRAEMIEVDKQREASLQAYQAKMSDLLLDKHLRESAPDDEIRITTRVLTLNLITRLDSTRKRSLLQFLYESGLIKKDNRIIDLNGAD